MTRVREIDDPDHLVAFLTAQGPDPYALANLEAPFWPNARWWVLEEGGRIAAAVGTVAEVLPMPILYAIAPEGHAATAALLDRIAPDLPDQMFGLLPLGVTVPGYACEEEEIHRQMAFVGRSAADPDVVWLGPDDRLEIEAFLERAYRDDEKGLRVFEPYMLERWPQAGLQAAGEMVAFAGTHVMTERFAAAALGNIVTRPDQRGRGLAGRLVRSLCHRLTALGAQRIGLNVAEANLAARRCYARVGFADAGRFREGLLSRTAGR